MEAIDRLPINRVRSLFWLGMYRQSITGKRLPMNGRQHSRVGPRELDYFKMVEAHSLKEQFSGWTKYDCDEKLKELTP